MAKKYTEVLRIRKFVQSSVEAHVHTVERPSHINCPGVLHSTTHTFIQFKNILLKHERFLLESDWNIIYPY